MGKQSLSLEPTPASARKQPKIWPEEVTSCFSRQWLLFIQWRTSNATVVFKLQSLSIMCGLCPQYPLSRKKDRNKNTHVLVSKKHRWDDLWIQYRVYFPTPDTGHLSAICILQLIRGKDKRPWWQTRHRRDRGSIVRSCSPLLSQTGNKGTHRHMQREEY